MHFGAAAGDAKGLVGQLDRALDRAYGNQESTLGNLRDPMDEALYLILAAQTDVPRARLTWVRLRQAFRSRESLANAQVLSLERALRPGGLQRQKARAIRRLVREVRKRYGRINLEALRMLDDRAAEGALLALSGMSWKSARCVMLYSLDRRVFPVDTNTFRIFKRVGILDPHAIYRRKALHDALQDLVPPNRRRRFHVNLVIHGQRVCRPRAPNCASCPVGGTCRKVGVGEVK